MATSTDSASAAGTSPNFSSSEKFGGKDGKGKKKSSPAIIPPGRTMPHSEEIERCVLSCLLIDASSLIDQAIMELDSEDFYLPSTRHIFDLIVELRQEQKPVEAVYMAELLKDRGLLADIGGPAKIAELTDKVPSPAQYQFYKEQLVHKANLRRVILACGDCMNLAFEEKEDSAPVIDETEKRFMQIRRQKDNGEHFKDLKERVHDAISNIELMVSNPEQMKGVLSGITGLDKLTNGFQRGDMIVVAARPSMGKTSFAMNVLEYASIDKQVPTAFFSCEMPSRQIVLRLLCSRARVSMQDLRSGMLEKGDLAKFTMAAKELSEGKLFIDDSSGLTISEIRAKARRYSQQKGIKMIAVDYLQLLRSTSIQARDNRQVEIAEISAGLKDIAKELDIPVLVVAQLNRAVDQRKGNRPVLSDLRESGAIEQDADMVGLLTREDYAGNMQEGDEGDSAFEEDLDPNAPADAQLIIAKNRNGQTGDIPMSFYSKYMRFEDRVFDPAQKAFQN